MFTLPKKRRRPDLITEVRITQLATYNAERSRGLVHTPEWVERMRAEQEWFDKEWRR